MKRTRLLNSELSHEISPEMFRAMMELFRTHGREPVVTEVPHDEFKDL
jgi:hypothetical protein